MLLCAAVCCGVQVAEDVFRIAGRDPMIEVAIALQVGTGTGCAACCFLAGVRAGWLHCPYWLHELRAVKLPYLPPRLVGAVLQDAALADDYFVLLSTVLLSAALVS